MLSQSAVSWMIGNVVVIDVFTLCYLVVDLLMGVPYSQEWNDWNSHRNPRFRAQSFILFPDGIDNLVKIAISVVRFVRNHFEHP